MTFLDNSVAVNLCGLTAYHDRVPFDPPEKYPEYQGSSIDPDNQVYEAVRETFNRLGMDKENYGTQDWNPFGESIKPGMTVFIKPNTVRHYHLEHKEFFSIVIHSSILRPILDYVCIALQGKGKIIIGDSQVIFGQFDKAYKKAMIDLLLDWYRKQTSIPIECFDLRIVRGTRTWMYGKWGRKKVEQDPLGYSWVNLGEQSAFDGLDASKFRVNIADPKKMYKHHINGKHEYLIPNSFLQSDVVINLAKFKTHRRTAVTLGIKNFVGIVALKDTMPHYQIGSVSEGGDQYINPSARKRMAVRLHDIIQSSPFVPVKFVAAFIKKIVWNSSRIIPFKDDIYEAMWPGNDTLWRLLLDLNRIVFYADKEGVIRENPTREQIVFIDGIIAGEKDGPVSPDPVHAGLLMAGYTPGAVDAVGASLMGFDINKTPIIKKTMETSNGPIPLFQDEPSSIKIVDEDGTYGFDEYQSIRNLNFEPPPTWKSHIERLLSVRSK